MQRLIDADELIRNLESIISDYTSNGIYPEKFGIDDFIDVVKEIPTLPAPQWISVEDNPPGNEYDFVLAYKPYLHEMGGSGMIVEHPWFVRMNKTYKYWMPLPKPPEERYKCRYADGDGVCDKCSENGEIIYCVEGPCPYMFEEARDDGKSKLD